MKFVVDKEWRMKIDGDSIADMNFVKDFGLETRQCYI